MTCRIGVLATHPIQYFAPLFRELAVRPGVELRVFYAHRPTSAEQGVGFGVPFTWDVDVLSGYEHEFLENEATVGRGAGFRGYDTPSVAERIRRGGFDAFLVLGWHAKAYWQAMRACWSARVPVLVRGDSQLGGGDRGARGLAKRLVYPRFVGRYAACLATGTRSEAYFRHYGARRVVRSPHFVDNDSFSRAAAAVDRAAGRRAFGLPEEGVVALFAGKLVGRKRPLDVIEAAKRANGAVSVLVVGDGEQRAECERAARDAGVPVAFAGFLNQSRIAEAYAVSDVIVLPSNDRETWGLVVNEAMACGCAAVVSDAVGCGPDLVLEGRTGFTHADGDVAALAAVLVTLGRDPGRTRAMGAAARSLVAGFTAARAADGVLEAARASGGSAGR